MSNVKCFVTYKVTQWCYINEEHSTRLYKTLILIATIQTQIVCHVKNILLSLAKYTYNSDSLTNILIHYYKNEYGVTQYCIEDFVFCFVTTAVDAGHFELEVKCSFKDI